MCSNFFVVIDFSVDNNEIFSAPAFNPVSRFNRGYVGYVKGKKEWFSLYVYCKLLHVIYYVHTFFLYINNALIFFLEEGSCDVITLFSRGTTNTKGIQNIVFTA